jgi:hypothetical protein
VSNKYLFVFLFLLGCKFKLDQQPDNLVSKDKMIAILAEIHMTEGKINNLNIQSSDTTQFIYRKMEAEIFKKNKVDTADYYKTYKYYLVNAEEFSDMYKDVVKIIKAQNKLDSIAEAKTQPKRVIPTKMGHPRNSADGAFINKIKSQNGLKERIQNGKP